MIRSTLVLAFIFVVMPSAPSLADVKVTYVSPESYEPWQPRFYDVRILRGTTPPRIKLRYELRYKGKKVSEGEETISDLNYLMNTPARLSSKRFAYEKHMLRHWFRKRFSS